MSLSITNRIILIVKERLYEPIYKKQGGIELNKMQTGEKTIGIDNKFLDSFLRDTQEGKKWCEEAAMHWAEILTFEFSKTIIAFDLGILAFISAIKDSFFDQRIFILSIAYAVISLIILTIFIRSVIVKNINSLAERTKILMWTLIISPGRIGDAKDAKTIGNIMREQGRSLSKNLVGLEDHVKIWMPWQKIGIYFFLFFSSICFNRLYF